MERGLELIAKLQSRTTLGLTKSPDSPRTNFVMGTDIEGPHAVGDTVDQAMVLRVRPQDAIEAFPMYGHIIYEQTYDWFSAHTLGSRRPNGYSLSQEGTDTIFTLPLLLSQGVDNDYLVKLTMQSATTPGAKQLVRSLEKQGVRVFGITTAPGDPYKSFFKEKGGLNPRRIIGSPFPLDETKRLLLEEGKFDQEIEMTQAFLGDCFKIIDRYSKIEAGDGNIPQRNFSPSGQKKLQERAAFYYSRELGITYSPVARKERSSQITLMGQVIEACGMVGDRAKAAVAKTALLQNGTRDAKLITMGDGANDAQMLKMADLSIGVNGPDAAKAAQIAFVSEDMRQMEPVIRLYMEGQRNTEALVREAQRYVTPETIVALGGENCNSEVLEAAKTTKKKIRGLYVTY